MSKSGKCKAGYYYCYTDKVCKPISKGMRVTARFSGNGKEPEEVGIDKSLNGDGNGGNGNGGGMSESKSGDSSLRDWFSKSRSSDGTPGWVQLGGKYAGKPCAKQPGQTTKPKCGSSKMKRNLSKDEEERAFRRKNRKDPNPDRKGKAINVATEETKKDHEYSMARSELKTVKDAVKRLEKKMGKKGEGNLEAWVQSKITKAADYIDTAADYVTNEEFVTLPLQVEVPNNIRDFNLGLMFRESLDKNSGMLFVFEEVAQQSFHMKETRIPLDIAFVREDGIIESIKQLEPFEENPVTSDGEVLYALEVNRGWFAENNVEVGDEINIVEGEKDACYHKVKSRYSVWPSAYASGALVKCRKVGAKNWGNKTKKEAVECNHTDNGVECPVHGMSSCKSAPKGGDGAKIGPNKNYVKPMSEAITLPRKTGQIIRVFLTFRGKLYIIQMFFPSVVKPSRAEVQAQIEKVYPGGKVRNYDVSDYEPGQPLLQTEGAAWTKKAGKNPEGGLNEKGRKSYERENPGSDLKAPSKKVGNKRRASFCARMKGMKKKLTSAKTANDPDSRINKSLRAWNC